MWASFDLQLSYQHGLLTRIEDVGYKLDKIKTLAGRLGFFGYCNVISQILLVGVSIL